MEIDSRISNFLKWLWIILVVILLAGITIWIISLWTSFPGDEIRSNITLEEAQSLVSFPICVPENLPHEVYPDPEIIYDADDAGVPEVTYIRLRYRNISDHEVVMEIYQRFTQKESLREVESPSSIESAKISLLYWMIPYHEFVVRPVDTIAEDLDINVKSNKNDWGNWGLYEITSPEKYRSTMTKWIGNNVEYRILSYLPVEEIKKVTISMFQCLDHYSGD
jgi:hypothetical protein